MIGNLFSFVAASSTRTVARRERSLDIHHDEHATNPSSDDAEEG